jgi:hypothetical protein
MHPSMGKVAMLLRTDFDHAKGRQHLFGQCPIFAKKLVLTRRIVWFEGPKAARHSTTLGIFGTGSKLVRPCLLIAELPHGAMHLNKIVSCLIFLRVSAIVRVTVTVSPISPPFKNLWWLADGASWRRRLHGDLLHPPANARGRVCLSAAKRRQSGETRRVLRRLVATAAVGLRFAPAVCRLLRRGIVHWAVTRRSRQNFRPGFFPGSRATFVGGRTRLWSANGPRLPPRATPRSHARR